MKRVFIAALVLAFPALGHAQVYGPAPPTPEEQRAAEANPVAAEQRAQAAEQRAQEAEQRYQEELAAHKNTQKGIAYKDLDEDVRVAAEKHAAARAKRLGFLLLPPDGIKWAALGVYLGALAGTGDLGAPMSVVAGASLKIYPSPWGLVAQGRVGLNYDDHAGDDYWGTTPMSPWGARYEVMLGWELAPVSLLIGYAGTSRHWSRIEGEGASAKVADDSSTSHGFVAYLGLNLRGTEIGFSCTVGTAAFPDQQGHVAQMFSGRASQCGALLTAPLFGF